MVELLVIGGGLLGHEVALASRDRFETALTYYSNPMEIEGCETFQMDITGNVDLILSLKPDYIVLTAAMTNVDRCESDREGAWKANAMGPKKVALAASEAGSRLIYVSPTMSSMARRACTARKRPPRPSTATARAS
jgi:dTDP-4-dehydrorhamnose reductase